MIAMRQIEPGDAVALAEFYNGLSAASKRTFRPLGMTTAVAACEAVICDNQPEVGEKFDLVAMDGARVIGWSFLWGLRAEPVFGLGVADVYHGQGVGGALMDRVLAEAHTRDIKHVVLTVVQDNEKAWRMYARRGFVRYGEFVEEADGLSYYRMALVRR